MPIFVFIDGYLLFSARYSPSKHLKRCIELFVLLIFWASVLILFGLYFDGNTQINAHNFFLELFDTQIANHFDGVLWFLINLLAVYIIYPVFKLVFDKNRKLYLLIRSAIAFFTVFLNLFQLLGDFIQVFTSVKRFQSILAFFRRFDPFGNERFLFYFLLGGTVFQYHQKFISHRWVWIAVGCLSISFAAFMGLFISNKTKSLYNPGFNYSQRMLTYFILGLFALCYPRKGNIPVISFLFSNLGSSTFGIYVTHFRFVRVASIHFQYLLFSQRLTAYAYVTLCSCVITATLSYIPYIRRLIRKKDSIKTNSRYLAKRVLLLPI